MLFIQLSEQYRADCNELVKLFLHENSYIYIEPENDSETDSECALNSVQDTMPAGFSTDYGIVNDETILRFDLHHDGNGKFLRGSLNRGNQVLFQEETPILNQKSDPHKDLKMPLKLLLYNLLSRFTGKTLPWGALTGIRPVKIINSLLVQGESIDDINRKMQEYYLVSEEKTRLAAEVALNEDKYLSVPPKSISIYIGIPFCTSRCLYCSFPSVSTQRCGSLTSDYLKALEREFCWTTDWMKKHHILLDTVYIGGGTPTAISDSEFEKLLMDLVPILPMDSFREYTVEAGRPDTINAAKLGMMKKAGVSRISINPQTMHNKTLRLIGRNHTAEQFTDAFHMARQEGFGNINCDLIAGLPSETLEDFQATLEQIMQISPESVTVHTMSLKRASRLNEEKDSFTRTDDDTVGEMIDLARVSLCRTGLKPYYLYRQKNILANLENVGYARPGFEGIYNILIMEEIQSILALGAGAVSKIVYPGNRIERIFNVKNVEQYIQRIDEMLERKRAMLERE